MLVFDTLNEALAHILPPTVRYECTHALVAVAAFAPDEQAYMTRLRPKRRLEFATGRHCAQAALAALGVNATSLGRESDGRPRWPPGVVGSISHCEGACVAAVADEQSLAMLGLDIEPRAPLPEDVVALVASPEEIAALPNHTFAGGCVPPLDTILFSAKESVYKALYPRVRHFFGFDDVSLTLSGDGRFEARLQPWLAQAAKHDVFEGRYALTQRNIVTTVWLVRR